MTNSLANAQQRVSAPRNDVDTEPLVRTASVPWVLYFIFTLQRLISFARERCSRRCPLDIDKLIKMGEWQPRIFAVELFLRLLLCNTHMLHEACSNYDVFRVSYAHNPGAH